MQTVNSDNNFGLNQYVVDQTAGNGSYSTIQSAIDAAGLAGSGTIYIKPGVYNENLSFSGIGGFGLIGSQAANDGTININGNVNISNFQGSLSFENMAFFSSSGDAFTVASTDGNAQELSFQSVNINSNAGIAINASCVAPSSYTIVLGQSNLQASSGCVVFSGSGAGVSCKGSFLFTGSGAVVDLNGVSSSSFILWSNLYSGGGNAVILRSASDFAVIADCVGSLGLEIVNFVAPGVVNCAHNAMQCSAPSGFWATGAGTLLYSGVAVVGSNQIDPAVTQQPIFNQPTYKIGRAITASQALSPHYSYYVTSGALSLSLPNSSMVGDIITVSLAGGTSWSITQGAGQSVQVGAASSTIGAGGSVSSTGVNGDSLTIECVSANLSWITTSLIGSLSII